MLRPIRPRPAGAGRNEVGVLWPASMDPPNMMTMNGKHEGTCPSCRSGDLITIAMTVSGRDLSFTTCHFCEAKWWHRDGETVPLQSVIGLVVEARA